MRSKPQDTVVVFHLPKNSGNSGWDVNGTRLFGSFHWKFSFFPVETSQWKFVFHFNTDFSSLLFLSPVPYLSRSFKRPGLPRLPRMELVANRTRFSQTEIPNRYFPKFFVNGKRPVSFTMRQFLSLLRHDIGQI